MNRVLLCAVLYTTSAAASPVTVTVATRLGLDGTRSLLVEIAGATDQTVAEIRLELRDDAANEALPLMLPSGWKLARDRRTLVLAGSAATLPLRCRLGIGNRPAPVDVKLAVSSEGRKVWEQRAPVTQLPPVRLVANLSGLLQLPPIVSPEEELELQVFDSRLTPPEGHWVVGGTVTKEKEGRLHVTLPASLRSNGPLRVTYFDPWGERLVEALVPEDVRVTPAPGSVSGGPRITGCAARAFIGQAVCVCGYFPSSSWNRLTIDGEPAGPPLTASSRLVFLRLPDSLPPGEHVIAGEPEAGFPATEQVSVRALRVRGEIDRNALLRGESTVMRLAVEGTEEVLQLQLHNQTPSVVSLDQGDYQAGTTSGGTPNSLERRVHAVSRGDFQIDYRLDDEPCPCAGGAAQQPAAPSAASQTPPFFVPRRVLALIPLASPVAMRATAQAIATSHGLAVLEVHALVSSNDGLVVFEILDGSEVLLKVAALAADPRVRLAQPDYVYDTATQSTESYRRLQYGTALIHADRVQRFSRGAGVKVALIDTGIDANHVALKGKIIEQVDVTGTGFTTDVHGTLLAGIIASEPVEGPGIEGVAPGSRLIGIKSCQPRSSQAVEARCWSVTVARGMDLAILKKARVMNLSVGGPQDRLLERLVETAVRGGATVVAAAGNDGPRGKPSFPAALPKVVAVTAVDALERPYPHSTPGDFVDLAAPGVEIVSTRPGGKLQLCSGTSVATAFVTGAVALLLEQRPRLGPIETLTLLERSARDLGPRGKDAQFGSGLVDVCRALAHLTARPDLCR